MPPSSLLKEAVPISTRIKQGKVGSFTKGMSGSHSTGKLGSGPGRTSFKNTADALRVSCNLNKGSKMDMYSASGGKFGRVHSAGAISNFLSPPVCNETDINLEKAEDMFVRYVYQRIKNNIPVVLHHCALCH